VSVVLITGASTGIGNLTAKALAADGHTVYASMRSVGDRNAAHAQELLDTAQRSGGPRRSTPDQEVVAPDSTAGRWDRKES
jgi:NAD(P)-dependent dehydrogenase (short-subunit alcohol dehydrogenase family)